MFITQCDDLGGGYCLDQTQEGDWAQYTINVLAPQTYMVEVRAEAIGANTGGIFECEFATNGHYYNNTGPLTITTTDWTNFSAVVFLQGGTNVMKLHCLTNAHGSSGVGRFNYISIYPWWQPGFTSTWTNYVSGLSTNNDYADALANAAAIQHEIDTLPSTGGSVFITNGTYYIAQASPNETLGAKYNAAVIIATNNIEIVGSGKSNTMLIAYNRATTCFCFGFDSHANPTPCTNFILRDITIEAQPHLAVADVTNTIFELGQLIPNNNVGDLTIFYGNYPYASNILITNCQFLYGDFCIRCLGAISNVLVQGCDFTIWSGSNVYGATNTINPTSNTCLYDGSVGIFCNPAYNVNIISNTYTGNANLTNGTFEEISTNINYNGFLNKNGLIAPDGFVWAQEGGNFFVARNTISNNALEGIQLNAGPNSVVGNIFQTEVSDGSCCALDVLGCWPGLTGTDQENYSTCFIGNSVYGGRSGQEASDGYIPYSFNCSGNTFTLYPPYDDAIHGDGPGTAAGCHMFQSASVCGNTLVTGGLGFGFIGVNTSALILNNNFGGATYRGIGCFGSPGYSLNTAQIFGNILGEGVSFHVQLPYTNSFGWFLGKNTYLNAYSNSVPPFMDPLSSAVHISN